MTIGHNTIDANADTLLEKVPAHNSRQNEDSECIHLDANNMTENQRENDHIEKRVQHAPAVA